MQPTEPESPAPAVAASVQLLSNSTPTPLSVLAASTPLSSIILPKPSLGSSPSTTNSPTPSQKDFAIALGVSQARISQLVKIGMPLNSIAAAKEWRVKRQRSNDESLSEVGESGSPDPGAAFDSKLQHAGIASSHGSTGPRAPPVQTAR
jgi:hypothetical protein